MKLRVRGSLTGSFGAIGVLLSNITGVCRSRNNIYIKTEFSYVGDFLLGAVFILNSWEEYPEGGQPNCEMWFNLYMKRTGRYIKSQPKSLTLRYSEINHFPSLFKSPMKSTLETII